MINIPLNMLNIEKKRKTFLYDTYFDSLILRKIW